MNKSEKWELIESDGAGGYVVKKLRSGRIVKRFGLLIQHRCRGLENNRAYDWFYRWELWEDNGGLHNFKGIKCKECKEKLPENIKHVIKVHLLSMLPI